MAKISKKLKDFLLQDSVKELIDENDFEGLYKKTEGVCPVGAITQVLYAAGIDPLRYLVHIPKGFLEYSDIEHFTIPNHIKSIGNRAFSGCRSLTSITLGNGVESIGSYAFWGCSGLTSISIPDSVTSIGNYAFYGCSKLTSITIPDSVTSIGSFAFYDCSGLTDITIGSGVTRLLTRTFLGCTKLRKINYNGTADQWKKIDIDGNNARLYSCRIICTDGMLKWDRETKKWIQV